MGFRINPLASRTLCTTRCGLMMITLKQHSPTSLGMCSVCGTHPQAQVS